MSTTVPARAHQEQALTALGAALAESDRAQLVMACGTGKTLIGRWHAERTGAGVTVVVVPSLGLVAQTLREWRNAGGWPFDAVITCSDPSTVGGEDERRRHDGDQDVPQHVWDSLRARVTTNPVVVARRLAHRPVQRPLVIFSTYHSAHVVAHALRSTGVVADLLIADEAHYLAGQPRAEFRVVLTDALPARAKVFMTATPVVSATGVGRGALSMDDAAMFGPVAYRLDFAEAIARELLCDYKVLVYETSLVNQAPCPVEALMVAAREGLHRVLSFHSRVARARAFADAVNGLQLPDGRTVVARAVAGTDPGAQRAQALELFAAARPDQLVVVASARCLSAGVDIPVVDGVLFADPKYSGVDVVQSVGRVLRRAPGKTHGLVMLPVCVPAGLDDDTALSAGTFSAVWGALRALRAMDTRFRSELVAVARPESRRGVNDGSRLDRLDRLHFDVPSLGEKHLTVRVVDLLSPAWDLRFAELEQFIAAHGHAWPQRQSPLGQWCRWQRRVYRAGMLDPDRAARLDGLHDWVWEPSDRLWLDQYRQVLALAEAAGGLDLDDPAIAAAPLQHPVMGGSRICTVGRWCAWQRQLARRGELASERRAQLARIRGWVWEPLCSQDAAAVMLLAEYVAWKGHANPPADCVEDDIALGRWLNAMRRRRATKRLSHVLFDEITIVSPADKNNGGLQWYRQETLWLLGLEALRQFASREGHCRVPYAHSEQLPDFTINLYKWVTAQRKDYRGGQLTDARVRLLSGIRGWEWCPSARARQEPPLTLPGVSARHAPCRIEGTVAAGPTWDRVGDLIGRGWTAAWIARELGFGIGGLELHVERINERVAGDIADLHRRIGDRSAPPRRTGRPLPPLRQILIDERAHRDRELVAAASVTRRPA